MSPKNSKLELAMQQALEYSRKLPYRPCSPYGQLAMDDAAVLSAFRLCYEELKKEWDREKAK